jgi:hypothetical protein
LKQFEMFKLFETVIMLKVRRSLMLLLLAALISAQPALAKDKPAVKRSEPSTVYFTKDISGQGVLKVFEKIRSGVRGKVAVKTHFGEQGNQNYLRPDLVEPLVKSLNATLVETNVLYSGPRQKTESHLALAKEHGFGFAPIDILDSEGDKAYACSTACYTRVITGSHTGRYNTIVMLTHFKGHGLAGFGGAIKNVAMGLASRAGKLAMHANYVPEADPAKCTKCGACAKQCPAGAISLYPVEIDPRQCIGCGQCQQVCPAKVFETGKSRVSPELFNKRLVEYAKVLADSNHLLYINVLVNISPDCDCAGRARKPFVSDIGILASTDIVAIEQASLDLVNKAHQCQDAFLKESGRSGNSQIGYAEKLGMGKRKYKLIKVD